ncbi:MAG: CCA tRNA nucleotidyltransferase [Kineothrix sp.]|nr:CCA tRNA nucleotidyltransferase [Kineothrix sp.]
MHINLPEKVENIISAIESGGYEAYAVGGCVRDSILGRVPDDWDITTSASPQQVKRLFKHTIDTGIQHGTVTVMFGKEGFEVTTYRIDGEYEDNRHPKEVAFTSNLREDLKRRDFTINAMAYNSRTGLVDVFGGLEDIQGRLIRCVGNPQERFEEDALRMMRAVRFSAQLGYAIEKGTEQAIRKMAGNLRFISAERIQTELVKLLVSPHPDYLRICYDVGITKTILPEFDWCMETAQNHPHHCYTVGEHILHSLKEVKGDKVLRLAMLFHDIGKPETKTTDENGRDHFHGHSAAGEGIARQALRRLRFDNDTVYKVCRLVLYHDYPVEMKAKSVRRAVHKIGEDIFPYLFDIKRADIFAQSDYGREEKLHKLGEIQAIYERIMEERQCVSLHTLAVTGRDLIEAGMKPGPELGETLEKLLQIVLECPEENEKDKLLEHVLKPNCR